MVNVLAIDVGSSSVKAAVLEGTSPVSALARVGFATLYGTGPDGSARAEVKASAVLKAVAKAAREAIASNTGKPVEVVALSTMSPSWVAMDRGGEALTPIVTHQDRRSVAEARRIEAAVGMGKHLAVAGNRPVPGGISSTTAAWFVRKEKALMRRADLVGHVQTLLLRQLTGARVTDPSNASFMGMWNTTALDLPTDGSAGWDQELVDVVGLKMRQLPQVVPGDSVAGELDARGAKLLGLPRGTPVITGVVDTTASILLGGAELGMMFNSVGSTDVLAVVTDDPRPGEHHLTRHLGVGQKWVHVMTLSAAGSSLIWAKKTLFSEMDEEAYYKLVLKLARQTVKTSTVCEPFFAGSRTSVEQPTGAFSGMNLATSREEMLTALIQSLARESAARVTHLRKVTPHKVLTDVLRTGGAGKVLGAVMYKNWPTFKTPWRFADVPEAAVMGLGKLAMGERV